MKEEIIVKKYELKNGYKLEYYFFKYWFYDYIEHFNKKFGNSLFNFKIFIHQLSKYKYEREKTEIYIALWNYKNKSCIIGSMILKNKKLYDIFVLNQVKKEKIKIIKKKLLKFVNYDIIN